MNTSEIHFEWGHFSQLFLKEWRRKVGQTLKPKYKRYVELKNKRAVLNGYNDYGDQWRQKYDTLTFEAQCLKLTQNVAFEFLNFGIFHQFLSY